MTDIIRHDFAADLEVRGDGRNVYGLCVPYDSPTMIRENGTSYEEVFRMGAFARTIEERMSRVKFLVNHNRGALPLGPAQMLREDPAGLVGEFRVSKTAAGDEALELIRDGALDAFSVGFAPIVDRGTPTQGLVERIEAKLIEVSAVAFPAYDLATIGGVRQIDDGTDQADDEPDQLEDAPDQGLSDPTFAARRRLRIELLTRSNQA